MYCKLGEVADLMEFETVLHATFVDSIKYCTGAKNDQNQFDLKSNIGLDLYTEFTSITRLTAIPWSVHDFKIMDEEQSLTVHQDLSSPFSPVR